MITRGYETILDKLVEWNSLLALISMSFVMLHFSLYLFMIYQLNETKDRFNILKAVQVVVPISHPSIQEFKMSPLKAQDRYKIWVWQDGRLESIKFNTDSSIMSWKSWCPRKSVERWVLEKFLRPPRTSSLVNYSKSELVESDRPLIQKKLF